MADAIVDEYGVKYSRDGLRLLKAPEDIEIYKIKDRAKIICDCAFQFCGSLYLLYIPKSIEAMGDCCFYGCESLKSLEIPDSVNFIGDLAFWGCLSLKNIQLSSPYSKPPSFSAPIIHHESKTINSDFAVHS